MKKAILFLSAALVALAACDKYEKDVVTTPSTSGNVVTFNVSVTNADDTKAVKNGWANGDKIYVFFQGLEAKWLVLTYNGSTWAAVPSTDISAGEFSSLGTKKLTAVHTPADVTIAWDSGNSKFTFTDNSTNSIKPIYNYYLLEEGKDYTVDGTTVNVTLAMGRPADYVWFYVDGISANVDQFYLKESHLTPTAPASVALTGGVTEVTKTTGYPIAGVALSTGGIYAAKEMTRAASTAYGFQLVKVNSASDMIATRTYTKGATTTLTAGKQYNLGAYNNVLKWTENQWVDLQFPSNNVLWATGNLTDDGSASNGGSIVEFNEYGALYGWGETVARPVNTGTGAGRRWAQEYAWYLPNAPFYNSESGTWTKYYQGDGVNRLADEDDAAYKQLDGEHTGWRMPTDSEISNLCNNATWTTSPTNGMLVTAPNGLNFFVFAACYGLGDDSHGGWVQTGVHYYLTKTKYNGASQSAGGCWGFHAIYNLVGNYNRMWGGSIKPVKPVGY